MKDAGIITICNLENTAEPGQMPKEKLVTVTAHTFEERVVGYGRLYAAMGVNEQVDMLVRIWREPLVRIGMYAVLTEYEGQQVAGGDQYRITNVQQLYDNDGLKVTDLTLTRTEELYDVAGET